jgi:glutamate dehydrogenase
MAEFVLLPLGHPPSSADTKRKASGLTIMTDMIADSFPEYIDTFESSDDTMTDSLLSPTAANRLVDKIRETDPSRHPSPQPTHVSYPLMAKVNGNGHRVLRSATVGYVSPEFKGKAEQMKQGEFCASLANLIVVAAPC